MEQMYSIKSLLTELAGLDDNAIFSESIFCAETTRQSTLLTNAMKSPLDSFTFTLIRQGTAKISYNGNIITLSQNDLFLYLPGLHVQVLEISEDYHGICLFIDREMVMANIFAGDFLKAAYFPAVRFNTPYVSLQPVVFNQLDKKLSDIKSYLNSDNPHKIEAAFLLFSLFLIDLHHSFVNRFGKSFPYTKNEILVIRFLQLLAQNHMKHRDISFYAEKLQISKVYLSRIIKNQTGMTVRQHIDLAIFIEARRFLINTDLPLKEIAYELGFADHACFTKFFKRLESVSPAQYRTQWVRKHQS